MDRCTLTLPLPPKGQFTSYTEEQFREINHSEMDVGDIYKRLQEYENTGLSPAEISAMIADNNRLHALLNEIESELPVSRKMK